MPDQDVPHPGKHMDVRMPARAGFTLERVVEPPSGISLMEGVPAEPADNLMP
ncbi:hypothetical protein [Spongiactinospora sp. TRM90649]|uniref:hypothetical protein n=1 Tax=Spongiactinospora sp. TRM90649 TaxID=3031114 RepID=UPI0023F8C6E6|nr:hypothetical protein [Spongiactinospora sp. TRM90649]MDF5756535.1 hypothetical protein [Spongiactinospora sp. TRM90649]